MKPKPVNPPTEAQQTAADFWRSCGLRWRDPRQRVRERLAGSPPPAPAP
jgi:hypothetical protein